MDGSVEGSKGFSRNQKLPVRITGRRVLGFLYIPVAYIQDVIKVLKGRGSRSDDVKQTNEREREREEEEEKSRTKK